MTAKRKSLSELARLVGGTVIGNGGVEITRVAPIEDAGPGDITFLAHPRYQAYLARSRATAIIIGPGIVRELDPGGARHYVEVADPYVAFAKILQFLSPPRVHSGEISGLARIDPSATLENGVTVFANVFIGKGVEVRRGSVLYPGVFLGEEVRVGEDCVLHPNVTVREGCRLGNRVILHAGVVVGSDGFGYAGYGDERIKIPQMGTVEVEDDVEIGANSTIDRATLGRTVIRRGTKIDNLVQIAHNVTIGENSIIAAQAGVAGSTQIGKNVILAGQVGVVNHVRIGDGARIGPQSGIPRSVPPGAVLSGGIAAAPHQDWLRVMTLLPQLPKLWSAVRRLEKKISRLAEEGEKESESHARR